VSAAPDATLRGLSFESPPFRQTISSFDSLSYDHTLPWAFQEISS